MEYMGRLYGDWPIPPGEFLEEEAEARGISREELSHRSGLSADVLKEFICGDRAFTAEFAMAIAKALGGTDPKFWLTLDARFQMTKVLIKDRDRERERAGQSSPDFEAVPAPDPG